MYNAFLINTTYKTEIETYETLNAAIAEQIKFGWEAEASDLLSCPVLIVDSKLCVAAIISYAVNPLDVDHPLLRVLWTETGKVSTYKWHAFRDSYEARMVTA